MRSLAFSWLALLFAGACGSNKNDGITGGGSGCATLLPGVTVDGANCATASAAAAMCSPVNDAYCAGNGSTNDCKDPKSRPIDSCGVSLAAPPKSAVLKRATTVKEFGGSGAPDIACFAPGTVKPADTAKSQLVKMTGIAKIFSHGEQSNNLTIEVHKVKRGGAEDGNPGELVGAAVTTDADCKATGITKENDNKDISYQCKYEYAGVPTETELLVLTSGMAWAPLYEYGLFIANGDVKNGGFEKDVRALAADDYQLIPQVGIGKTITAGHGVVAGEVHDCGNIRLSGAVADIDKPRFALEYFAGSEANPSPDVTAKATNALGLYSAFDVAPGPVTVAAAGVLDGKLVSLGYFRARVFSNAVSTYTFRGLRPFQVK